MNQRQRRGRRKTFYEIYLAHQARREFLPNVGTFQGTFYESETVHSRFKTKNDAAVDCACI